MICRRFPRKTYGFLYRKRDGQNTDNLLFTWERRKHIHSEILAFEKAEERAIYLLSFCYDTKKRSQQNPIPASDYVQWYISFHNMSSERFSSGRSPAADAAGSRYIRCYLFGRQQSLVENGNWYLLFWVRWSEVSLQRKRTRIKRIEERSRAGRIEKRVD